MLGLSSGFRLLGDHVSCWGFAVDRPDERKDMCFLCSALFLFVKDADWRVSTIVVSFLSFRHFKKKKKLEAKRPTVLL